MQRSVLNDVFLQWIFKYYKLSVVRQGVHELTLTHVQSVQETYTWDFIKIVSIPHYYVCFAQVQFITTIYAAWLFGAALCMVEEA